MPIIITYVDTQKKTASVQTLEDLIIDREPLGLFLINYGQRSPAQVPANEFHHAISVADTRQGGRVKRYYLPEGKFNRLTAALELRETSIAAGSYAPRHEDIEAGSASISHVTDDSLGYSANRFSLLHHDSDPIVDAKAALTNLQILLAQDTTPRELKNKVAITRTLLATAYQTAPEIHAIKDHWLRGLIVTAIGVISAYPLGTPSYHGYATIPGLANMPQEIGAPLSSFAAVASNALLNAYFMHQGFDTLANGAKEARKFFKQISEGKCDVTWESFYHKGIKPLIQFSLSVISSSVFFALSVINRESLVVSVAVLLAYTAIHYEGAGVLLNEIMPILAKHLGLSSLGRFIADKAYPKAFVKEKHVLAARMQQVKSIRTTALHNAYQTFEDIMQEADPDKRARYMKLMTKAEGESEEEAKTKANILFYELLCESAARYKKEHGAIAAGRKTLEWITRLAVFPTLSGYTLQTIEGLARAFHYDEHSTEARIIGGVAMSPLLALVAYVAGSKADLIYDTLLHGLQGIIRFLKAPRENFNLHNFLKLPLAFQHNPKILISMLGLLYALVYFGVSTPLQINRETYQETFGHHTFGDGSVSTALGLAGKPIAQALYEITWRETLVIAALFNALPISGMLSLLGKNYHLRYGSQAHKDEINLASKIQSFQQQEKEKSGDQLIHELMAMIHLFYTTDDTPNQITESAVRGIFGGKEPAALLKTPMQYNNYSSLAADLLLRDVFVDFRHYLKTQLQHELPTGDRRKTFSGDFKDYSLPNLNRYLKKYLENPRSQRVLNELEKIFQGDAAAIRSLAFKALHLQKNYPIESFPVNRDLENMMFAYFGGQSLKEVFGETKHDTWAANIVALSQEYQCLYLEENFKKAQEAKAAAETGRESPKSAGSQEEDALLGGGKTPRRYGARCFSCC